MARLLLENRGPNDSDSEFLSTAGSMRPDSVLRELMEESEYMLVHHPELIPERSELTELMFENFEHLAADDEELAQRRASAS